MTNRDHIINFCGAARALVTQTKVMTDQELADIYAMTAVFTRLLDDTRKELVARCKAHGNAGGYILRPVSGCFIPEIGIVCRPEDIFPSAEEIIQFVLIVLH